MRVKKSIADIDFSRRNGLIPVVLQDRKTKDILMLAYTNREALHNTIKTGNAWFWSTSRGKLWMKGEDSGNIQPVKEIRVDCDSDALVYLMLITSFLLVYKRTPLNHERKITSVISNSFLLLIKTIL